MEMCLEEYVTLYALVVQECLEAFRSTFRMLSGCSEEAPTRLSEVFCVSKALEFFWKQEVGVCVCVSTAHCKVVPNIPLYEGS